MMILGDQQQLSVHYILDNDARIFYYADSLIYAVLLCGASRSHLNGARYKNECCDIFGPLSVSVGK
jgi:hypothetical protein